MSDIVVSDDEDLFSTPPESLNDEIDLLCPICSRVFHNYVDLHFHANKCIDSDQEKVPYLDDNVVYKGETVKFRLLLLKVGVETAKNNISELNQGKTNIKWNRAFVTEEIKGDVESAQYWNENILRQRMKKAEIDAQSEIETELSQLKAELDTLRKKIDVIYTQKYENSQPNPKLNVKSQQIKEISAVKEVFQNQKEPKVDNPEIANRKRAETLKGTLSIKNAARYDNSRFYRENSVQAFKKQNGNFEQKAKEKSSSESDDNEPVEKTVKKFLKSQLKDPKQYQSSQIFNQQSSFPLYPYGIGMPYGGFGYHQPGGFGVGGFPPGGFFLFPPGADGGFPAGADVGFPAGADVRFPPAADVGFPAGADVMFPPAADVGFPAGADVGFPPAADVGFPAGADGGVPPRPVGGVPPGPVGGVPPRPVGDFPAGGFLPTGPGSMSGAGPPAPDLVVEVIPPGLPDHGRSVTTSDLRKVTVPVAFMRKFLAMAGSNTKRNVETCGILGGKLVKNSFVVTHLVIPKQSGTSDTCSMEGEEYLVNYMDKEGLMTLGWIHTHPTQTAFLSSVDMHCQYGYQVMLPEALAIVCSPKYEETGLFSLTQDGLLVIGRCPQVGFHSHPDEQPLFEQGSHVRLDVIGDVVVKDLRF